MIYLLSDLHADLDFLALKEYVKIAIESESNLQNQIIDVQIHNRSQIIH